jgi:RNA polymerase sigma factor for flagellar operon FliA
MNVRAYAASAPARTPERERLIVEHLDMARRIAMRVGRRVPADIREEDLIAAAMIGLTEAADRYDGSRGEPFVAFAEKRIRGAVLDELRKGDIMPRRMRAAARKVGQTVRELSAKLGREPEDEEIAKALGVTVEEYLTDLEGLTHVSAVDLDSVQSEERFQSEEASPEASTARKILVERVQAALQTLPKRDAIVMSLYYVEELSYAEIGKMIGVTESRVCQIHSRCLARLRAELTEEDN